MWRAVCRAYEPHRLWWRPLRLRPYRRLIARHVVLAQTSAQAMLQAVNDIGEKGWIA